VAGDLAEGAANEPSRHMQMEAAWRALADEQDWLNGEASPARNRDGRPDARRNLICRTAQLQTARNNPVCEPVSFAGHSVRISVARRGPRLNPMPPRGRGAVSANTVRWRCRPG
jgi:hypothetical protein